MKKQGNFILTVFLVILFFQVTQGAVASDQTDSLTSRVSLEVIPPENQVDPMVQYFDLMMKPSQKQTVLMKLTNHTDGEIEMNLTYNTAKTTSIGEVEYSENPLLESDESLKYEFNQIVTGPKTISLKPNAETDVPFDIQMPVDEFEGFITGGIEFTEAIKKIAQTKDSVVTESSYLIGVRLRETTKEIPTDVHLKDVFVSQKDYKNAVIVSLANINGNYVEDLTTEIKIKEDGKEAILSQSRNAEMRMAPNSRMEYPVYLGDTILDVGNYVAEVTIKTKNGFEKSWKEKFRVSAEERELLSDTREVWENQEEPFNWIKTLLLTGGLLLIFGLIALYLSQNDRAQEILKRKK